LPPLGCNKMQLFSIVRSEKWKKVSWSTSMCGDLWNSYLPFGHLLSTLWQLKSCMIVSLMALLKNYPFLVDYLYLLACILFIFLSKLQLSSHP
jgi:hypothetical protein